MNDIELQGTIFGFEEIGNYLLTNPFGPSSHFRVLSSRDGSVSFIVVNPFAILSEYEVEVDNEMIRQLSIDEREKVNIALLCIVRKEEKDLYVNLRCPIVINTERCIFKQIILDKEEYGMSVPFAQRRP